MQGWTLIMSHLPAMDRRLLSCIVCCTFQAKVQIYERYKKRMTSFQELCRTRKSKLAKSLDGAVISGNQLGKYAYPKCLYE